MRCIVLSLIVLVASIPIIVFCLVIFGTAKPPNPLSSITNPFATMNYSGLPPIERYRTRDGAELSFRYYPAKSKQVAVLIHGSSGSSSDMHAMAQALQASGVVVYVPDLRGHGANYPHGDVVYTGQLDDDMTDFLHVVQPSHPEAKWTLIGFSSGGGFALRIAAEPIGRCFDRYILLSPFLRYDAATVRRSAPSPGKPTVEKEQVWSTTSIGRILGLLVLDGVGIHRLDGLPVIHFAVPPNIPSLTANYSWRMQQSFQPHNDFRADIRSVSRPMRVFVGEDDQLFLPKKFQEVFDAERKDIPVTILPGLGHSDMATSAEAIRAVAATFENSEMSHQ
jgi:pimeloyl-ACP methyl ester carboxylesterase